MTIGIPMRMAHSCQVANPGLVFLHSRAPFTEVRIHFFILGLNLRRCLHELKKLVLIGARVSTYD